MEGNIWAYPGLDEPINSLQGHWQALFNVLDPLRVTIVAPPPILSLLVAYRMNIVDTYMFHMPYHILSLARSQPQNRSRRDHIATENDLTLLHFRPWHSLLLNEGSFGRIHQFFDPVPRPPSILPGLAGV